MRYYPGVVGVVCVACIAMDASGERRQQIKPRRTRRDNLSSKFVSEMFNHISGLGKNSEIVEMAKRGLKASKGHTGGDGAIDKLISEVEMNNKQAEDMLRGIQKVLPAGKARNKHEHVMMEAKKIYSTHDQVDLLERQILVHLFSPMKPALLRDVFKRMNANNSSRRQKIQELIKCVPQALPMQVADKALRALRLRMELYRLETSLLAFTLRHFDRENMAHLNIDLGELQNALRTNIADNPVQTSQ